MGIIINSSSTTITQSKNEVCSCSSHPVPLWLPLNPGEVDMANTVDTVDTAVDTGVTVDTAMVDTVGNDLLMLNPGEVDTVDMVDMADTAVDTEDMVDTDTADTVARETLKLNQKPLL